MAYSNRLGETKQPWQEGADPTTNMADFKFECVIVTRFISCIRPCWTVDTERRDDGRTTKSRRPFFAAANSAGITL